MADKQVFIVVRGFTDMLTDGELAGVGLAIEPGTIKCHPAYKKIKGLLTSEDQMHQETKAAFLAISDDRLGEPKGNESKKFMAWYENEHKTKAQKGEGGAR